MGVFREWAASKHRYRPRSEMICQNRAIGTKSPFKDGKRWKMRRDVAGPDAHTRHAYGSFLSHFSPPPPHSPVFRTRLRRDLPQTNHEKKRKEKRGETAERAREGVRLRRKNERKRDGKRGWKKARLRPHTPERLQHADDKEESRAREKEDRERNGRVVAREGKGGCMRGTEFILRAFFYRSLTPRSPL